MVFLLYVLGGALSGFWFGVQEEWCKLTWSNIDNNLKKVWGSVAGILLVTVGTVSIVKRNELVKKNILEELM